MHQIAHICTYIFKNFPEVIPPESHKPLPLARVTVPLFQSFHGRWNKHPAHGDSKFELFGFVTKTAGWVGPILYYMLALQESITDILIYMKRSMHHKLNYDNQTNN